MIKLLQSKFPTKRLLLGYRRNKSLILKDNIRVFIINPPTNDHFQFISSKMKCLIAALFGNKNWKACQMASTLALRYKHSNAMLFDLVATENAKRFQITDHFSVLQICNYILKLHSSYRSPYCYVLLEVYSHVPRHVHYQVGGHQKLVWLRVFCTKSRYCWEN